MARLLAAAAALTLVLACSEAGGPGASAEGGAEGGASAAADGAGATRAMAPDFALKTLSGHDIRLADLRGKTVVIDFWATWCPPCEFQVPELNAFWEAHRDDGDVEVLGISVDVDGPEVVRPWVTEKGVGYTILMGDEDLARKFGAVGFPTLFIIAPDGSVDSQHVGLIETADLEEALTRQRAGSS